MPFEQDFLRYIVYHRRLMVASFVWSDRCIFRTWSKACATAADSIRSPVSVVILLSCLKVPNVEHTCISWWASSAVATEILNNILLIADACIDAIQLASKAVFRCFAKKFCDGILLIWSTKWSLFIKLFHRWVVNREMNLIMLINS